MKLSEIVAAAKSENPEAFGKVSDKRAAAIVRLVLNTLSKQVEAAEEGEVALQRFGKFIVKQRKVKKDGKESVRRRVVFRAVKAKK